MVKAKLSEMLVSVGMTARALEAPAATRSRPSLAGLPAPFGESAVKPAAPSELETGRPAGSPGEGVAGDGECVLALDDEPGWQEPVKLMDWRMLELLGASVSLDGEHRGKACTNPARRRKSFIPGHGRGECWRLTEVAGASGALSAEDVCATGSDPDARARPAGVPPLAPVPSSSQTLAQRSARATVPAAQTPRRSLLQQPMGKAEEGDWRWQEVAGAAAGGAPTAKRHGSRGRRPGRRCSSAQRWRDEEVMAAHSEAAVSAIAPEEPEAPREGDLVALGAGAPPEFRQCPAIVTQVSERHCTVVVLDAHGRCGVGECWPSFEDVTVESRAFRLGARVAITGLKGPNTRHLNGFTGSVIAHPRRGHPTFVQKPSPPGHPQLTLCVGLDDPRGAGESSVLMEARFLVPYDDHVASQAQVLGDVVAGLSGLSSKEGRGQVELPPRSVGKGGS